MSDRATKYTGTTVAIPDFDLENEDFGSGVLADAILHCTVSFLVRFLNVRTLCEKRMQVVLEYRFAVVERFQEDCRRLAHILGRLVFRVNVGPRAI
jgi:hypothetical protein